MAENTKIEWADATVNWWAGCSAVSPACDNCYAKRMAGRLWGTQWGPGQPRTQFTGPAEALRALDRKAKRLGRPLLVFHNSMSDFFDNEVPNEWREDAFRAMAERQNLIHLLLTKRIGNVGNMLPVPFDFDRLYPNVWLGATIVNQEEADRDIPKLLQVPAAKRFLSMEPLLGPVDLFMVAVPPEHDQLRRPWDFDSSKFNALQEHDEDRFHQPPAALDWVIVGGESGPGARECHVSHIRSIVQQCKAAGVPVFVKQLGAQPRGWCAANVHIDPKEAAELDADHCDFYEAHECSAPCPGRCPVFTDKKCGDPAEWPEDLRVREVPHAR